MYSFFILGQVPGTNIVISFGMWLQLLLAASVTFVLFKIRKRTQSATRATSLLLPPTISD